MPPEGSRRRKRPALFDIVVIPVGEGERTTTVRASRMRIVLFVAAAFVLCLGIAYLLLAFTPLAGVVSIPNPALERRYGQQITSLQQQLTVLVQDVELLNREIFTTVAEAGGLLEGWQKEYNSLRPHSALASRPQALEA